MNIIQFPTRKEQQTNTITGPARCLGCGHQWTAASPSGTTEFECPQCSLIKGVRTGLIEPDNNTAILFCACGNSYFIFVDNGWLLCPTCGDWKNPNEIIHNE